MSEYASYIKEQKRKAKRKIELIDERYRKAAAKKERAKNAKPAKTKDMGVVGYVYSMTKELDFDNMKGGLFGLKTKWIIRKHRVIKTTKKQIHVAKKPCGSSDLKHNGCFVLDRECIEGEGKQYHCSARMNFFRDEKGAHRYKMECQARINGQTQTLFDMIDIDGKITKKAVRSAYLAKAKELHPDKGGDADAFIRLKDLYEAFTASMA